MSADHIVTGGLPERNPSDLAAAIVKRPGMYMGGPVAFDRAAAYAHGLEMALLIQGRNSPLTDEDNRLLRSGNDDQRSPEEELDDIKLLEPVLARLLWAVQQGSGLPALRSVLSSTRSPGCRLARDLGEWPTTTRLESPAPWFPTHAAEPRPADVLGLPWPPLETQTESSRAS